MSPTQVLTPTQPGPRAGAIQNVNTHVPLKAFPTSRSLRWNLPTSDSAISRVSRQDEDTTLCYAPRSDSCDLTACASASSGLKIKSILLPSFVELPLYNLPEIPDWYEDERPRQDSDSPEPTETLDTPQSDYHSVADFHPTSLCCQDAMEECSNIVAQAESPPLSNLKRNLPEPPSTMPAAPHRHGRPLAAQHRRRSYSLDLADRRPAELPCTTSPDAGWGCGLGSPFCLFAFPSSAQLGPIPSDADLNDVYSGADDHPVHYHTSPRSFTPCPSLHLNQSPPSMRRAEALAVWRPQGPVPTHSDAGSPFDVKSPPDSLSDWDALSLEQPFPSTASIWVLATQAPSGLPHPLHRTVLDPPRRAAGESGTVGLHKWSVEEQITIAVLEAMDLRDMGRGPCSRVVVGKKGKVRRLMARIWRRESVW
ncbi:hypothetical protein DFH09DRAFT_1138879 [Mycena vulgaris]|nr:hypothetical protein DFH09DRAFT_1138879 [Mycena vulgaris]